MSYDPNIQKRGNFDVNTDNAVVAGTTTTFDGDVIFNSGVSVSGATITDITIGGTATINTVELSAIDRIAVSVANIVDVFIYDTSKDSDGGAWRDRCQDKSWYNETLNTATRGATRKFPAKALIVATSQTVTIYDMDSPDTPMWMVFTGAGANMLSADGSTHLVKSINMINGLLVYGASPNGKVGVIDFITEKLKMYRSSANLYGHSLPISGRNSGTNYDTGINIKIANGDTNSVYAKVLPNAPIDNDRGLPITTVLGATNSGVSVILPNSTVADLVDVASDDALNVVITEKNSVVFTNATQTDLDVFHSGSYDSDSTTPDDVYGIATIPALLANPSATKYGLSAMSGDEVAVGHATGLTLLSQDTTTQASGMVNYITDTYNTGWMIGDSRGAWLANSKTVDRSLNANALTENGTITETAIATGAELMAYSGFTAANNLTAASNAEWDVITTGALTMSIWFKSAGNSAVEFYFGFGASGDAKYFSTALQVDGTIKFFEKGSTAATLLASTATYDDGQWHKLDFVRTSSTARALWIDGVLIDIDTTDAGSLADTGNLPLGVGIYFDGSASPALTSSLALARISAYAPSEAQIKKAYEDEKYLFQENASALLSNSTAVGSLSYDADTDLLYAGTADGTSVFKGLERVDYIDSTGVQTSDTITAVSGVNGSYAIGTSAEAVVNQPAVNIREALTEATEKELPLVGISLNDDGETEIANDINALGDVAITGTFTGASTGVFTSYLGTNGEVGDATYPNDFGGAGRFGGALTVGGDVYTTAWTDYGGTSTISGFSSTSYKIIRYKKIGKMVFVTFDIRGTSDDTDLSFTLPYTSSNADSLDFSISLGLAKDNSSFLTNAGRISLEDNSTTVNVYSDAGTGAWTASNDKWAAGQFWYEAQ